MTDTEDENPEPATWENVVAGKAKEAIGHALRDENLAEEGEEQVEIAHDVRDEFEENEHD